jgi:hypothetical protein
MDNFFAYRWGPDGTRMLIEHDVSVVPSAVGFKLKYQQFDRVPGLKQYFSKHCDVKIIHLVRPNLLATLASSRLVGQLFDQFGTANLTPEMPTDRLDRSVTLNPRTIEAELELRSSVAKTIMSRFTTHEVTYENLITSPIDTCKRILNFLDVETCHPLKSRYKKTMPAELSKGIRNYPQIKECLRGTRFEELLGETPWARESIFT